MVEPLAEHDPIVARLNRVMGEFGMSAGTFTPAPSGVNRSWIAEGITIDSETTRRFGMKLLVTGRSKHSTISPEYLASVTASAEPFGTFGYLTTAGDEYRPADRTRYWTDEGFVPQAIENPQKITVEVEGRTFMVRRFVPGEVVRKINEKQAHAIGRLLGDLDSHYWPDITIFGESTILNDPETDPSMPKRLLGLLERSESIRDDWRDGHRYANNGVPMVIHGDLFLDNIVWRGDRPVPIDWETAGFAPPELDLAVAILGCCRRDGKTSRRLTTAIIEGYGTPIRSDRLDSALTVAKAHLAVNRWWRNDDRWKEMA